MRENRPYGSEGGEAKSLPYPYPAESLFESSIASPVVAPRGPPFGGSPEEQDCKTSKRER
jgi:hypothetical protein